MKSIFRFERCSLFSVLIFLLCVFFCINIFAVENVFWKSIPIKTIGDLESGHVGGEGFQMVQSLVFSPSDPSILYMSTDTSQVWKSTNEGKSWYSVANNFMSNGAVSLAVSPNNSNLVFAAGSYGADKLRAQKFPKRLEGIYKTTDGGANWVLLRKTSFYRNIVKGNLIVFANSNADKLNNFVVYAGSHSEGLIASYDMGSSWYTIGQKLEDITDIKVDAQKTDLIYIADKSGLYTFSPKNRLTKIGKNLPGRPLAIALGLDNHVWVTIEGYGIYKSIDMGINFSSLDSDSAVSLAVSPVDSTLLFSKSNMTRFKNREPQVSNDGGRSWSSSTFKDVLEPVFNEHKKGFWFTAPFAAHPVNREIILTVSNGQGRILRSEDAGKSWNYSGDGFTGGRMKDMSFLDTGQIIFALTDHGLWISNKNDISLFSYIQTPRIKKQNSCSAVAVSNNKIVAAVGTWKDKAIIVSNDKGKHWSKNMHTLSNHKFIGYDPNNSQNIYAGYFLSRNGGRTWLKINYDIRAVDPRGWVYALDVTGKSVSLMVSRDNANTWNILGSKLPVSAVNDIAIANKQRKVYLATNIGVIVVKNGKWQLKNEKNNLSKDIYGLTTVSSIALDPNNEDIVYVGRRSPGRGPSNGVFKSVNGGETWSNITTNIGPYISVWSLNVDPQNGTIYIGTSRGTFSY